MESKCSKQNGERRALIDRDLLHLAIRELLSTHTPDQLLNSAETRSGSAKSAGILSGSEAHRITLDACHRASTLGKGGTRRVVHHEGSMQKPRRLRLLNNRRRRD